jgi:hypothetical protein
MSDTLNSKEQELACALLHKINGRVSPSLDSFSGWLLGGFGAASTLLASQYDSLVKHVEPQAIRCLLTLFLLSLVVGVVEKYLSVIVSLSSQGSDIGIEVAQKALSDSAAFNLENVLLAVEKSVFPPMRWAVHHSFEKAKKGDWISLARNMTRVAQIQGLLVLLQAALVIQATYKIAHAFHI